MDRQADGATLGPGDGSDPAPDIAAHSAPGERKQTWSSKLDAEFSRPLTGRSWQQPNGPACRHSGRSGLRLPLTRTEPPSPPASTHCGSARPDKGVTSDKMFPATTHHGARLNIRVPNSRTAGPLARTVQVLQLHGRGPTRLQLYDVSRAEAEVTRIIRAGCHVDNSLPQIAPTLLDSHLHELRRITASSFSDFRVSPQTSLSICLVPPCLPPLPFTEVG